MHTNLILSFNSLNTRVLWFKSRNSYCYTTSQPAFVSFAMHTACLLLKLKRSILLVMYSWLKAFTVK